HHPAPQLYRNYSDLRQSGYPVFAANCPTLAGGIAMLTRAVETYLAVRRAAGFELRCEGSFLQNFAAFSEARQQHHISAKTAIEWAGLAQAVPQRARRLGIIIRFASYLRPEEKRHTVPPAVFGAESPPLVTSYTSRAGQRRTLTLA